MVSFLNKVSHVCQRWREVAISTATLWGRVPFSLPAWVSESLVRSQGAPLLISYAFPDENSYDSDSSILRIESTLAELQRVKELSLSGPVSKTTLKSLGSILNSKGAPLLEEFTLSLSSTRTANNPFTLPSKIFLSELPRLRHVSISGPVVIPWCSHIFTGLTFIEICDPSGKSPSMEQISAILSRNRQLVELALTGSALPSPSPASASSPHSPVPLDNLERLCLEGSIPSCSRLTSLITVPASTRVSITIWNKQNQSLSAEDGLSSFSSLSRPEARTASLEITSCRSLTLSAWKTVENPRWCNDYYRRQSRALSFDMHTFHEHELCRPAFLLSFKHLVGLEALHALHLELTCTSAVLDAHHWRQLLAPCRELRVLHIVGEASTTFLKALSPKDGHESSGSEASNGACSFFGHAYTLCIHDLYSFMTSLIPTQDQGLIYLPGEALRKRPHGLDQMGARA